ncbi:hypothetical protein RF11_03430 [Thelohanellus kitauei]|uniref:Uncharacterized protein n=1 Tax=Thelohanellus kitauei TaxID=669202 RepID=A0A0C2JBM5_THEKT|nr:hypothetical protein RF11_03430 [Thelohanellus kitauei]
MTKYRFRKEIPTRNKLYYKYSRVRNGNLDSWAVIPRLNEVTRKFHQFKHIREINKTSTLYAPESKSRGSRAVFLNEGAANNHTEIAHVQIVSHSSIENMPPWYRIFSRQRNGGECLVGVSPAQLNSVSRSVPSRSVTLSHVNNISIAVGVKFVPDKDQEATYFVSDIITKNIKSHTRAKTVILSSNQESVMIMFAEAATLDINKIMLSEKAIIRLILDTPSDIELNIVSQIIDMNTDITGKALYIYCFY